MKTLEKSLLLSVFLMLFSCEYTSGKRSASSSTQENPPMTVQDLSQYKTAYFASGCFWCVEAIFESVKGVKEAISGYAGGSEPNPTYEQVSYGRTTHAEAVEVFYDPEEVSYATLVEVFFGSHDPTTLNRQGPDAGPQYRSIAFYNNAEEEEILREYVKELKEKKVFRDPIVTEITKIDKFWEAEDYHQDYEKRNPDNPYVQKVSVPRLKKFQKKYPELLKEGVH